MRVAGRMEPDKGWAWLVLLAAFLSNIIFDGIIFSFGVFYLEFLDYFGEGHARTSWIGSVISAVYALIGPIASVLVNKFGCRAVCIAGSILASAGFLLCTLSPNIWIMIVTYSIMGGFGFGLMYLCSYVMIGHYFERRRSLATGLASCGSGLGTFMLAPVSMALIEYFGWKGALWILAGFILNGTVMGCIYRPPVAKGGHYEDITKKPKKLMDFTLLKNPSFLVFCMSSFLCMIGFFVPFIYLPDFVRTHGISREDGAFLISIIGITNTIGRVICGYVCDKPWADSLKIYNAALIIGGAAVAVCTWLNSFPLLAVFAAIFGFSIAAYVSLCAIILVEFLGIEKLSNSFGFLNMFRGIATFIGAPVAGMLYDFTGDYHVAFYVAGAAIASAGVICLPLRVFHQCQVFEPIHEFEKDKTLRLTKVGDVTYIDSKVDIVVSIDKSLQDSTIDKKDQSCTHTENQELMRQNITVV